MTIFFLSEMCRARKHLVIQTAGVRLWSTSERQTLRYRASLSRAHWIPHSADASDRTQLPGPHSGSLSRQCLRPTPKQKSKQKQNSEKEIKSSQVNSGGRFLHQASDFQLLIWSCSVLRERLCLAVAPREAKQQRIADIFISL